MLVEDFKKFFNAMEVRMGEQFRNETIQEFQLKDTKGDNMILRVLCTPTDDRQYGNNYSCFVKDEEAANQITGDFSVGNKVLVIFRDGNPYVNKFGKQVTPRDLVALKPPNVDVNEDVHEGTPEPKLPSESATEPQSKYSGAVRDSDPWEIDSNTAMRRGALSHGSLGQIVSAEIRMGFWDSSEQVDFRIKKLFELLEVEYVRKI